MLYEFDHQHTQSLNAKLGLELTDEQLMAGLKAQNQEALATLYRRHTPLLRTIMGRVLGNETDVDDLLQEVFVELWNRAERYDEAKGKALGWIVTLARRRAIDRVRKKQAYARAAERLREQSAGGAEPMHPAADEEVASSDVAQLFQRVIATLPSAQRQALHLAYYAGLSQRDIAHRTGIPLGTIKTRLELALRKVRGGLLAFGGEVEWQAARS